MKNENGSNLNFTSAPKWWWVQPTTEYMEHITLHGETHGSTPHLTPCNMQMLLVGRQMAAPNFIDTVHLVGQKFGLRLGKQYENNRKKKQTLFSKVQIRKQNEQQIKNI